MLPSVFSYSIVSSVELKSCFLAAQICAGRVGRVETINISNPIQGSGSGTYWKCYVRSTFTCEPTRQDTRVDNRDG